MIYLRVNNQVNKSRKENHVCRHQKRTLAETMTWRITASLTTFIIAWILTGNLAIGASIGAIEAIAKIFLYYFHERIWTNINFN